MAISVGSVTVAVVPSAEDFSRRLRESLLPQADIIGREAGDRLKAAIEGRVRDVKIGADTDFARARAEISDLSRKADELGRKRENIEVNVNNASGIRSWIVSLIAGAAAIAPAFVVAGIGVSAFATLAAHDVAAVTKYLQDFHKDSVKAAQDWQALTEKQKIAATQVLSLKGSYDQLSQSIEPQVFDVFEAALDVLRQVLPEVTNVAKAAGAAIASTIHGIGSAFTDSEAQKFFAFISTQIGPDMAQITDTVINLIHLFFTLTEALSPLSLALLRTLTVVTQFLSYLAMHAPILLDVALMAVALYKPLKVIEGLKLLSAFTWVKSAIAWMGEFVVATEGATLAQRGLFAAELAADALNPFGWIVVATAGLAGLALWLSKSDVNMKSVTDSIAKQNDATGFNAKGYQDAAKAVGEYSRQNEGAVTPIYNVHTGMQEGTLRAGDLTGATRQLTEAQKELVQEGTRTNAFLNELQQKYGLTRDQAMQVAQAAGISGDAVAKGSLSFRDAMNRVEGYEEVLRDSHTPQHQFAVDLDGISNSAAGAATQVKTLTDAYNLMITPQLNAEAAVVQMKNDLLAMNKALGESKGRIGDATQAQRNSFDTFNTYIGDIQKTEQATLNATGAQRAHDLQVLRNSIPALEQIAKKNESLRGVIHALIQTILAIPKHENVSIGVTGKGDWSIIQKGAAGTGQISGLRNIGRKSAQGWYVSGGTPGVDSVPILGMPGELMVPKPMVDAGAVDHLRGKIPGFAEGGVIGHYSGTVPGTGKFVNTEYRATVEAIMAATAAATAAAIAKAVASAIEGLTGPSPLPGGGDPARNAALARRIYPRWGTGSEWNAWNAVAMRESGWNQFAYNPSGATGIPQALPYTKMPRAGWLPSQGGQANPGVQISWMVGYMQGRYGDPIGALSHENNFGWYAHGTGGAAPGWGVVGEEGPELVRFHGGETVLSHPDSMSALGIPGYAKGTSKDPMKDLQRSQWLHELAKFVAELNKDEKFASKRRKELNSYIAREELFILTHPGMSKINRQVHDMALRADRRSLHDFNVRENKKEGKLKEEIHLLRVLTGFPQKKKYGGPGLPGGDGSGGDDGSGDGGAGDGSGGTPPPVALPPPSFEGGAGGAGGFVQGGGSNSGALAFTPFNPGTAGTTGTGYYGSPGIVGSGGSGGSGYGSGDIASRLDMLISIGRSSPFVGANAFAQGVNGIGRTIRLNSLYNVR